MGSSRACPFWDVLAEASSAYSEGMKRERELPPRRERGIPIEPGAPRQPAQFGSRLFRLIFSVVVGRSRAVRGLRSGVGEGGGGPAAAGASVFGVVPSVGSLVVWSALIAGPVVLGRTVVGSLVVAPA
jgi:hypothetical protein